MTFGCILRVHCVHSWLGKLSTGKGKAMTVKQLIAELSCIDGDLLVLGKGQLGNDAFTIVTACERLTAQGRRVAVVHVSDLDDHDTNAAVRLAEWN
jgi:hypothetical protein